MLNTNGDFFGFDNSENTEPELSLIAIKYSDEQKKNMKEMDSSPKFRKRPHSCEKCCEIVSQIRKKKKKENHNYNKN